MNSFGRLFRVSVFGESHGESLGAVIDGCPPGIRLSISDLKPALERRRSGAEGTTARTEPDIPVIESGIHRGFTTGAPVLIRFCNTDARSEDYCSTGRFPRPGHADFTAVQKFAGFNDPRGGGHFSGRLTLGIVAAGVIALKIIEPVQIDAVLLEAGGCGDIDEAVKKAVREMDSIGGIIECRASNIPVGIGEPFFDSVESLISHAVFAVPGVRGIEFGEGFKAASARGSEHSDDILSIDGKTATNNCGGINGGITNGNELVFRVCIKPTSSTGHPRNTVDMATGESAVAEPAGRHDTCFALRCPVIVESAAAMVIADLALCHGSKSVPGRESIFHGNLSGKPTKGS